MGKPVIEIEHLVKNYGTLRALDGLDLTVGEGEIFGFLGPNGSGKTTAFKSNACETWCVILVSVS